MAFPSVDEMTSVTDKEIPAAMQTVVVSSYPVFEAHEASYIHQVQDTSTTIEHQHGGLCDADRQAQVSILSMLSKLKVANVTCQDTYDLEASQSTVSEDSENTPNITSTALHTELEAIETPKPELEHSLLERVHNRAFSGDSIEGLPRTSLQEAEQLATIPYVRLVVGY